MSVTVKTDLQPIIDKKEWAAKRLEKMKFSHFPITRIDHSRPFFRIFMLGLKSHQIISSKRSSERGSFSISIVT